MLLELQDALNQKSAMLDVANARIAYLEHTLMIKESSIKKDKCEMELVKEQFNKELSEIKEECRILNEEYCHYKEQKEEEESKCTLLEELPMFTSDAIMVESSISVNDQVIEHGIADGTCFIFNNEVFSTSTTITPK